MKQFMVFVRFKAFFPAVILLLNGIAALAQQPTPTATPAATPTPKKEQKAQEKKAEKFDPANVTAEQVVESTIIIYGFPGGRQLLNQIRKTTTERGKLSIFNAQGKNEQINYQRWIIRADTLDKEKNRFEQDFPNAKYSLVYNGEKVFGLFNDSSFAPREDAARSFQNQIWHGLEALLRYKENESKLELAGREKINGVEYYLIDITDKQSRKTRFFVSTKSFRAMMLEYQSDNVKYRRKFYDYNYAQGTLVPYRSVLWAGDRQIEELEIGTITFGQKVDEAIFQEAIF